MGGRGMTHGAARRSMRGSTRLVAAVGLSILVSSAVFWTGAGAASAGAPAARPAALAAPGDPVASDDEYTTTVGTILTVAAPGFLGNDTDLPAGSSYRRLADADHNAANSFSPDGAFSYTPDDGFVGDDSYTYCISPSFGGGDCLSNIATILIHVVPLPVAVDDTYSTVVDTVLTVAAPGILGNDTDLPAAPNFAMTAVFGHAADWDLADDGSVSYTPVAGFTGDDTASYCITESPSNFGCVSNSATVTIHVVAAPPPSSTPPSSTSPSDTAPASDDPGTGSVSSGSDAGGASDLASTGSPAGALTLVGLLAVLIGGLLVAGNRRDRGRRS
jgi:hypothetical protein